MTNQDNHVPERPVSSLDPSSYNYPFAAAPDIIRCHQKDAYFQGQVLDHLSGIMRRVYGARFLHTYTTEARTVSDLLYLALTTLAGNRTLGEEYCDIIQVEDDTLRLPSISRRAGYILASVLLPYALNRILPSFRASLRSKLESSLRRISRKNDQRSNSYKLRSYILEHLSSLTSPSPVHALTLTIFYFTGAYYQLSKRLFRLRYIFTKRIEPSEARAGYEVLGLLLLLQMSVQGWLHLQSTWRSAVVPPVPANASSIVGRSAMLDAGVEISLDPNAYSSNNQVLLESSGPLVPSHLAVAKTTHTPVLAQHRYHLEDSQVMSWIKGRQQRKCTLCLEELKDPAAPQCGHVFCWSCIGDWVKEKPECPLCRRAAMSQHILPLRS
ncbi:MAG: peroxisome biogenesis factor 10 [Claussenomyces sp. TS43310]|nr:MAG: peroxisome biogenesis factor 10 [Claussenomyces sp. TS43310]